MTTLWSFEKVLPTYCQKKVETPRPLQQTMALAFAGPPYEYASRLSLEPIVVPEVSHQGPFAEPLTYLFLTQKGQSVEQRLR